MVQAHPFLCHTFLLCWFTFDDGHQHTPDGPPWLWFCCGFYHFDWNKNTECAILLIKYHKICNTGSNCSLQHRGEQSLTKGECTCADIFLLWISLQVRSKSAVTCRVCFGWCYGYPPYTLNLGESARTKKTCGRFFCLENFYYMWMAIWKPHLYVLCCKLLRIRITNQR